MITLRMLLVCCVVLAGGVPSVVHAFSLGELQLLSKPGQPFQATAPIKLGTNESITSVAIGSSSDYTLLNLPHSAVVEKLTAQVKEQPEGPVVWLQSNAPIQEDDFFILLRVASNQHTFFPFFRLRSAAATANPTQPKKAAASKKGGEATKPDLAQVKLPDVDASAPVVEEGKPIDPSTLEKIPFFAMAGKAIHALTGSSGDSKKTAPAAATKAATPQSETVAVEKSVVEQLSVPKEGKGDTSSPAAQKKTAAKEGEGDASSPAAQKKTAAKGGKADAGKESPKRSAAADGTPSTTGPEHVGQGRLYGPIREGETLSEIAQKLHLYKGEASFFQAVVALWKHNPDQFIRNNMNGLRIGTLLVIPSAEEISQVDIQEARQLRLSHGLAWKKPIREQQDMPQPTATLVAAAPREAAPLAEQPLPSPPAAMTQVDLPEIGSVAKEPPPPAVVPAPPVAAKAAAEGLPKGENEELKAILAQLQVITRVLENNQAQQDRLEQRISTLEQARKEWDFLRERINELEQAKASSTAAAPSEPPKPAAFQWGQTELLWLGGGVVGLVVLVGLLFSWLGRRWNKTDHWKNLQALLSATARQDPQLLRKALQENEPSFGREFVPVVHNQKLEGVAPAMQKRIVEGDISEAANKLRSMSGHKE
ncbi:MAG: hypothetical protein HQL80_09065 [Magnetococcales bacterium]|nr:hypothetical protein [Magnetococcales bacterium]